MHANAIRKREVGMGNVHLLPAPPGSLSETGLSTGFVLELALKHLHRGGELTLAALSDRLGLGAKILDPLLGFARSEQLVEVPRRGTLDSDVTYSLTDKGRGRAEDALAKSQYVGVAPVTLERYEAQVARQTSHGMRVTPEALREAFAGMIVPESLVEQMGAALNSERSIYVYGPSGSGKTFLAEHLMKVLWGSICVPHAIVVDDQVIQLFDPVVHRPVGVSQAPGGLDRLQRHDARWIVVERPVVVSGGELTLELLDLEFDPVTRFYNAPPQLKANNGMLVVDDLGRQKVSARELLNRWIVPLDRRVDYLALHTGTKFKVPFDVRVVFSSNLAPSQLADPAFVRRLGYKVFVGPMAEQEYRQVIRLACGRAGIEFTDEAADFLIGELHVRSGTPLLPAFPYDVVGKLRDRARFHGGEPCLDREQLTWAWHMYFAGDEAVGAEGPTVLEGEN
jgi:hypothetical protein